MEIDYTIGDDIVCIDDSNTVGIKENNTYKVRGLSLTPCCNLPIVDVGIRDNSSFRGCIRCKKVYNDVTESYSASRFKKLDTLVNISELTEILENTVPFEV